MSQERLSMRKISEALRLKWVCGLSNREVGRSCHISHSTVSEYLKRAEAAGLKWPMPETLDEDGLYRLLFPERVQEAAPAKLLPDWEQVRKELKRRSVTLRLLWTEYREGRVDGYSYSQYCELYRRYVKKLDPPIRQNHKVGEKLFVDYAGDTIPITNSESGEVSQAQIFVAVQGASSYTYAEAQSSQQMANWIAGCWRRSPCLRALRLLRVRRSGGERGRWAAERGGSGVSGDNGAGVALSAGVSGCPQPLSGALLSGATGWG